MLASACLGFADDFSPPRAISFGTEDIRRELPFLEVELVFELEGQEFRLTRRQWKEDIAADDQANLERLRRQILESERLRDRARILLRELDESQTVKDSDLFTPSKAELRRVARALSISKLHLFSTNRSVVAAKTGLGKAAGRTAVAYAELTPRSWEVAVCQLDAGSVSWLPNEQGTAFSSTAAAAGFCPPMGTPIRPRRPRL
jgi:hypothetical protein